MERRWHTVVDVVPSRQSNAVMMPARGRSVDAVNTSGQTSEPIELISMVWPL
jgi:hypothetical protein